MKYATLESKTFPFPFRGNSDDVTGFTAMRVVDLTSSTRCPLLRRVLAMQKENSVLLKYSSDMALFALFKY